MKKKMVYLIITSVALFGSFEIGRQTQMNTTGEKVVKTMPNGVDLADDTQYSYIDKFIGSITDWNTDGKELAIMTSDGYELYAYKQDKSRILTVYGFLMEKGTFIISCSINALNRKI